MQLADIDAAAVASEVVRMVEDHIHGLALHLGTMARLSEGPGDLRATAYALALYAQRGLPVWDWTDSGMAADGLLAVLSALYSRAADADLDGTAIDVVDDVDPDSDIGLVLVAAAARIRLDREEPVTARELGALSGVTAIYIRRLVAAGELPATGRPARIPAEDARRWLAAHQTRRLQGADR